jgi:hypothetical protein
MKHFRRYPMPINPHTVKVSQKRTFLTQYNLLFLTAIGDIIFYKSDGYGGRRMIEEPQPRRDYDNLLKTALKQGLWDGLKLFLPELWEVADKSKPVEFLDKELQKVTFDLEGGTNRLDMLAKITLMEDEQVYVLCHQEYQGEGGGDLPTRMYRYKEAIHLLYSKEPIGIAVILNRRPKGEKTFYHANTFGIEVYYKYKF